ncbi:hypothetical protein MRX96_054455 [Rhipicephalus microplus]
MTSESPTDNEPTMNEPDRSFGLHFFSDTSERQSPGGFHKRTHIPQHHSAASKEEDFPIAQRRQRWTHKPCIEKKGKLGGGKGGPRRVTTQVQLASRHGVPRLQPENPNGKPTGHRRIPLSDLLSR